MAPAAGTALDLGCGTGVLAAALARARPGARRARRRPVRRRGRLRRGHRRRQRPRASGSGWSGTTPPSSLPDGSVDLVVCNPPFHVGAAVVTTAADRLFAAAARVLRPGGELWTVYNSALRYKPVLGRLVGPTRRWPADPEVHGDGVHPPLTAHAHPLLAAADHVAPSVPTGQGSAPWRRHRVDRRVRDSAAGRSQGSAAPRSAPSCSAARRCRRRRSARPASRAPIRWSPPCTCTPATAPGEARSWEQQYASAAPALTSSGTPTTTSAPAPATT